MTPSVIRCDTAEDHEFLRRPVLSKVYAKVSSRKSHVVPRATGDKDSALTLYL